MVSKHNPTTAKFKPARGWYLSLRRTLKVCVDQRSAKKTPECKLIKICLQPRLQSVKATHFFDRSVFHSQPEEWTRGCINRCTRQMKQVSQTQRKKCALMSEQPAGEPSLLIQEASPEQLTQANSAFHKDATSGIGKSANTTKLEVNKMSKHYTWHLWIFVPESRQISSGGPFIVFTTGKNDLEHRIWKWTDYCTTQTMALVKSNLCMHHLTETWCRIRCHYLIFMSSSSPQTNLQMSCVLCG